MVEAKPPFTAASWQRKFSRAQVHLQQLTELVDAFLATQPYSAVEEVNEQDRSTGPNPFASVSRTFRGVIRDKPPSEWSPIIGDCLNNLRSSLDHMAWALANGEGRQTAFPIFTSSEEYKRVTPVRHLRYVREDAHTLIEGVQPYHHLDGPEAHPLFLLDRLTNDDKHRELLATEVGVAHIQVDSPIGPMAAGDLLSFEFAAVEQLFEDGAILTKYHSSNPNIYVPLQFTFDVALDPKGPAGGKRLLTCLASLSCVVWLVLREMEARFFEGRLQRPISPPLGGRAQFVGV